MKLFTKYSDVFVLFASIILSGFYLFKASNYLAKYQDCTNEVLKETYFLTSNSYFLNSISALITGIALASIVHSLRYIAYKNEK